MRAAAAAGRLRCGRCGVALRLDQVRLVRRRLPHRWATLPLCAACAETPPPAAGPPVDPGPAPGPAGQAAPLARLGRFLGRAPLGVVALEASAATAAAGEAELGVTRCAPAEDFDPGIGPTVRALHQHYGDVTVRLPLPFAHK